MSKVPRLRVKSLRLEEYDWRGLLALLTVGGYITLLALRVPGVEMLGVAVGIIVGWYFTEKRKEKTVIKFPRATEKHPEYKTIKTSLIEALRSMEAYNPAYDDMLVSEIAKTVIDIRTVDRSIDQAENVEDLREAVRVKAVLLGMLEKCLRSLAVTRRDRLDRDQMAEFKDSLERRLKQVLES